MMTGYLRSRSARTAFIAIGAFVVLAMPKSAFGVAWPDVSADIGLDIADLGLIVAIYVSGYFVGVLSVGTLANRFGAGPILVTAGGVATLALGGYGVAGTWPFLVGSAIVLGIGGGWLDAGLNSYVALHRGARVMNWLHAGYGVGSALGPLLITGLVAAQANWRVGFWLIAALQAGVVIALISTIREWDGPTARVPPGRVPRRPIVFWALLVFMVYVGLEVSAAQWGFTLLTEGRLISKGIAGLSVTGFFVTYTGARILLGIAGDRVSPARVAGYGAIAAVACTSLLWWSPAAWVAAVSFVALGAALGPIFPLQTLLTPSRVGSAATTTMVGYQMAAASFGAILIPGSLSPLVKALGVGVIAPVMTLNAVLVVVVSEAVRRSLVRHPCEPHHAAS